MLAAWSLFRFAGGALRLFAVLAVIGSLAALAVHLKSVGAIQMQRDYAVALNEEQANTLDAVLAEIKGIRELQKEQRQALDLVATDMVEIGAAIARIKGAWLHTPIQELLTENESD